MSVPVQTPSKEYIANGTTTAFPLEFNCDKAEYLIVTLNGEDAPVGSWTLANDTVTFNVAPPNGVVVNLERNTPFQRTTNYQLYDNSFRPSAVNKDFDLIWWKLQELGYRDQVIWLALVKEIADRIAGDDNLQNQINTIDEWLANLQQNVNENTSDIAQLVTDLSKEIADRIANDEALKEMFLAMMDEAINEGTINALAITHVDSLEALEAIANVWDGRTVYVKDLGHYEYDSDTTTWVKVYQDADNVRDGDQTQKEINNLNRLKNLVSITDFGAKGDGITDDSNAIQAALDTGKSIFIPETNNFWKVTRRMELKAVGQKVYGMGSKSLVKMVNALVCESVFRAADLGKNRFENVYAIPSVDGTLNWGGGVGFTIQRSHGSSVVNCEVSDHRGGGVSLLGSSYCYISGNYIHDSVVVEDEAIGRWGNDITVNNGSFNIIDNNRCINGCGIGIAVQNLVETDISNSNKITNNIVKDQPVYGIMLYKKFPADQIVGNEICNNIIENITGSIREPAGYAYGCGIYVQTADYTLVHGNTVKDAMGRSKDGTAPHEIHTPAGIGVASVANCTITDNDVQGSGWYGIQVISSTDLAARGAGIKIADNDVQGSNRIGIYVQDIPKVSIINNTVNQLAGSQAILVRQTALDQSIFALVTNNEMQSDNVCFESTGNIAYVKFNDNTAEGTKAGYAVQLGGVRVDALSNYINPANTSASGIRIGTNVTTGSLDDNDIVKGNIGIGYASATTGNMFIGEKNRNSASIPFHNGTSQSMWRPLENSATPSVQGINLAIQNNATNITGLTWSVRGQRVVLKAGVAFNIINGASMKLAGGVNFAMAAGNLITLFNDDGIWREESRSLTT